MNFAAETFSVSVGPSKRQNGDKIGAAIGLAQKLALDALHRRSEILARAGPARRIDSGRAVQGGNDEARIIRERGQRAGHRRSAGLQLRIFLEGGADLVGFRQTEVARAYRYDVVGTKQVLHLGELTAIMGGDHQPTAAKAPCHR